MNYYQFNAQDGFTDNQSMLDDNQRINFENIEKNFYQCKNEDNEFDSNSIQMQTVENVRKNSKKLSTGSNGGCTKRIRHKSGVSSYADLITSAISSSDNSMLSLAEIYDWMADNVPCLHSQRYLHSSKGWKNAVRHTLSVNNRFQKIARIGRPSLWTTADVANHPQLNRNADNSNLAFAQTGSSAELDNTFLELEVFRSRSGSEPSYVNPTLSLKRRRNTTDLGRDDDSSIAAKAKFVADRLRAKNSTEMQTVKVTKDDGVTTFVTIDTPIHLKTTVVEDSGIQTVDEISSPNSTASGNDNWLFDNTFCDSLFSNELAPSVNASAIKPLDILTEECNFDKIDWQKELHLDQSDLQVINHAFTTGWLTDDNL